MTNSIFQCGYHFLYFICFHIEKQLILHGVVINLLVLIEMRLGILSMPHHDCWPSARSKFWGVVRVGGQGWGDNSVQFINFGRVGDKSFKEWRQKIGGWKGG